MQQAFLITSKSKKEIFTFSHLTWTWYLIDTSSKLLSLVVGLAASNLNGLTPSVSSRNRTNAPCCHVSSGFTANRHVSFGLAPRCCWTALSLQLVMNEEQGQIGTNQSGTKEEKALNAINFFHDAVGTKQVYFRFYCQKKKFPTKPVWLGIDSRVYMSLTRVHRVCSEFDKKMSLLPISFIGTN